MCDERLLLNTKNVLKYLVDIGPSDQTVDSLYFAFYDYTGSHIPLYDLGYSYVVTFFQNIPDILEVDPKSLQVKSSKQIGNTSTFSYGKDKNYVPRKLPWVRSTSLSNGNGSNNQLPLEIKNPTSSALTLGARTYGDGKCSSSSDSIASQVDNEARSAEHKSLNSSDDVNAVVRQISKLAIRFYEPKDEFQLTPNHLENKNSDNSKDDNCSHQCESEDGAIPDDVCTKNDGILSDVQIFQSASGFNDEAPVETILNESVYYNIDDCYLSSSGEANLSIASHDSAIPFTFIELDQEINMINSYFFNGEYGYKYETTDIDDLVEIGSFYKVYVSEVFSPFKIWFHLGDDDPHPVDELQKDINLCYNLEYGVPGVIREEHLKKGYACVALYDNVWHRGEIQGRAKNGQVSIFFVDYGTIDQVSTQSVRYILGVFCSQPKLCNRGTLDFVKPIDLRWNIYGTEFLISWVRNRKLTAEVTEIDGKTNSARFILTTCDSNVNINKMLVLNGYAYPDDPRERYQQHIADALPS